MSASTALPPDVLTAFVPHTGTIVSVTQPPQGMNVTVWQIDGANGHFIVKSSTDPERLADIAREAALLQHLTPFAPHVALPLTQHENYYLFSYLPGVNLAVSVSDTTNTETRLALCHEHGRLLQIIHGWRPALPPHGNWFADAFTRAESQARHYGLQTPVRARSLWDGQTYGDLWEEIARTQHDITPRIVFCHGDWCLPNVLIEDGKATGAVDWSAGGWADYRTDLATGLWSLRYNLGHLDHDPHLPRYLDTFLHGYGYDGDVASLRFWEALYLLI